MSYIEVYFNSLLQDTIAIADHPVSIGRADHNQIFIDNKGVSSLHAVISKKDEDWFIEDLNSTNGTYLNGVKVEAKQKIKFGDTITICKHSLKFVSTRSQAQAIKSGGPSTTGHTDDAERTILIGGHKNQNPERTETQANSQNCHLLVSGEARNIHKLLLNRDSFTIGKGKENDLRVGGWFTPKVIAQIQRIGGNFYLSPLVSKLVKVNGRDATSQIKLTNDDNIAIKKMTIKFIAE